MEKQFLNVVVRPSEEIRQQTIQWSRDIAKNFKCNYTLDDKTCFVHLTIYQAEYPTKNRNSVEKELAELARCIKPFTVNFAAFMPYIGFVFYNATLPNPPLLQLHQLLVKKLDPLREGAINKMFESMLKLKEVPEAKKRKIITFGSPNVHDTYNPHITITRLTQQKEATDAIQLLKFKPFHFTAQELYLAECGDDGRCPRFLTSFPFQQA